MLSRAIGNNLYPLVRQLFLSSFGLILLSLFFRFTFSILQVVAIWVLIYWVNGNVPQSLLEATNIEQDSLVFPVACSLFLMLSAGASFLSKILAIRAVKKFEENLCNDAAKVNFGDYWSVAKLLLSVVDAIIPVLFVIVVVILWSLEYPWMMAVALLLVFLGVWLLKKGVTYASPFYAINPNKNKGNYLCSAERTRFYKILMVPQYISMVASMGVLLLLVASVMVSKLYIPVGDAYHSLLIIVTIMSLIQLKSFVGLVVKMGAYNKNVKNLVKSLAE